MTRQPGFERVAYLANPSQPSLNGTPSLGVSTVHRECPPPIGRPPGVSERRRLSFAFQTPRRFCVFKHLGRFGLSGLVALGGSPRLRNKTLRHKLCRPGLSGIAYIFLSSQEQKPKLGAICGGGLGGGW